MKIDKKNLIEFKNKYRFLIYTTLIFILAFYLRTFNLNWDNNYYFHPDERAIVMYASPLKFPESFQDFFTPESSLNPHFFAYGNFPLYLAKGFGALLSPLNESFANYGGMHIVGRVISSSADSLTVILVVIIGSILFSKKAGLFAGFLYSSSVFSIQTSHFFAVDTLLTFFMFATLLFLLLYLNSLSKKSLILAGVFFGLSLATKVSSAILIPLVIVTLVLPYVNKNHKFRFTKFLSNFFVFGISAILVFIVTEPYVIIDFKNFISQTTLQSQMSHDPFIFPYTLQYVGKIPYLYELKNIFLFGQGPLIFLLASFGIIYAIKNYLPIWKKNIGVTFLLLFGIFYFVVFGKFAVGWMRYMLPLYPFLAIFGGLMVSTLIDKLPKKIIKKYLYRKLLLFSFVIIMLTYPISFLSIYTKPNTRIQASDWINQHVPPGSTIAVEHWDDALPVYNGYNYVQITLPLYDPDTEPKWESISNLLSNTQYLVIASNRLYVPLQKLTNCKNLPPGRCYPITAMYYKDLFSEKSGFKKVAEFAEYPTIPLLKVKINDQSADESFTVYDHPKVLIFKNEKYIQH